MKHFRRQHRKLCPKLGGQVIYRDRLAAETALAEAGNEDSRATWCPGHSHWHVISNIP